MSVYDVTPDALARAGTRWVRETETLTGVAMTIASGLTSVAAACGDPQVASAAYSTGARWAQAAAGTAAVMASTGAAIVLSARQYSSAEQGAVDLLSPVAGVLLR